MRYPPGRGGIPLFCAAGYRCPGHTVLPRHSALDAEVWSYRATTRYPEISAKAIPTRGSFLDPASECGVTRHVHSSQQQEERTKKCRRCYRASSLGGCHRLRGLRNSLRSNSPRPSSSVGWSPPGPIKAVFASRSQLACALCGYGHSVHSRHSSLDAESRYRDEVV